MLKLKKLFSDEELIRYQQNFSKSLKSTKPENTVPLTLEYMKRCQVYAVFNQNNHMVAGFILGFTSPFRLLEFVPKNAEIKISPSFKWDQCCEIVCMWKEPCITRFEMVQNVWIHIFELFLSSKSQYLLGHNQSTKLSQYYSIVGPTNLYIGPSIFGLPSQLFVYPKFKISILNKFLVLFYYWLEFKKRFKSLAGAKETL
tara:strand:+ start:17777 stop:18376 length:600 start_codon:yes stop_codon:yes gene_type:complete